MDVTQLYGLKSITATQIVLKISQKIKALDFSLGDQIMKGRVTKTFE